MGARIYFSIFSIIFFVHFSCANACILFFISWICTEYCFSSSSVSIISSRLCFSLDSMIDWVLIKFGTYLAKWNSSIFITILFWLHKFLYLTRGNINNTQEYWAKRWSQSVINNITFDPHRPSFADLHHLFTKVLPKSKKLQKRSSFFDRARGLLLCSFDEPDPSVVRASDRKRGALWCCIEFAHLSHSLCVCFYHSDVRADGHLGWIEPDVFWYRNHGFQDSGH